MAIRNKYLDQARMGLQGVGGGIMGGFGADPRMQAQMQQAQMFQRAIPSTPDPRMQEQAKQMQAYAQQAAQQAQMQQAQMQPPPAYGGMRQQGGGYGRMQPPTSLSADFQRRGIIPAIPLDDPSQQPRQMGRGFPGGGPGWGMPPRQPFMDNRAIDPSQSFNMGVAQRYMSPYQQAVTDIEKREARRESGQRGAGLGLEAARSGGLGGYREAIMQSERERNLGQQLGDIQARGLQGGYDRAAQQLQADRSATLAAQQQQLGAAGTLGQLGAQEQALGMERLQGMEAAGQRQRAFQQAMLDVGYQDFQRQLGYPQQQMGFQQQLIHGLPIPTTVSQSTYARQPGMFQTGLGLGLQGLGLYNAMQGGGGG